MDSLHISKRGKKYMSSPHPASKFFEEYFKNPYSKSNPNGLIIAGIAENKVLHGKIIEKLSQFKISNTQDLCYTEPIGSSDLRKSLLSIMKLMTKRNLDINNLAVSAGVTAVLVNLFMVICDQDDGVLVPTPCYGSFLSDIEDVPDCRFVQVKTKSENQFIPTIEDLDNAYNEEINNNRKVSVLLLTNPDNPTGRLMTKDNLISYMKWAKEKSLHIVVDEIYALSSFNGEFISSFDIVDEFFDGDDYFKYKHHVIHGLSKDFGMSGFRVGYLYTENDDLMKSFSKINLSSMVSTFTQRAIQFLLDDKDWVSNYLKEMNMKLKQTYEKVASFLNDHDIPFIESNAGIFITLDLRKYLKENSFNEEDRLFNHIAYNHNLFINAGKSFYFSEPGFFRMIFADLDEIDVILDRLYKALQSFE